MINLCIGGNQCTFFIIPFSYIKARLILTVARDLVMFANQNQSGLPSFRD